jgi:hypothetical protein
MADHDDQAGHDDISPQPRQQRRSLAHDDLQVKGGSSTRGTTAIGRSPDASYRFSRGAPWRTCPREGCIEQHSRSALRASRATGHAPPRTGGAQTEAASQRLRQPSYEEAGFTSSSRRGENTKVAGRFQVVAPCGGCIRQRLGLGRPSAMEFVTRTPEVARLIAGQSCRPSRRRIEKALGSR